MIDILRTLIICVSLHPISNQQKIDMQKNLVIVESPAKAKTIEKFLGKDYKVMSSYGHIRDLKTKEFSIDIEHDYAPQYVIPADKKKLVSELKSEAKSAEQVWLASDEDRETMIRLAVNDAEVLIPEDYLPYPTYDALLFYI